MISKAELTSYKLEENIDIYLKLSFDEKREVLNSFYRTTSDSSSWTLVGSCEDDEEGWKLLEEKELKDSLLPALLVNGGEEASERKSTFTEFKFKQQ